MRYTGFVNYLLVLLLSPLLLGIVNRIKAFFAGRAGQPVLQLYYDLAKLFKKGAVYSRTATGIFRAGPAAGLASVMTALLFMPFGRSPSLVSFQGDVILVIYLLAMARFFTVLAALDTGSSFEGMGSSREVQFSVFAEPALFLGMGALIHLTGKFSLTGIYSALSVQTWAAAGHILALVFGAFVIVFLTENSRIPIDDPNTHLELTMIHEVMVLDHGGVDLGFILYSAALKFWFLGFFVAGLIIPESTGVLPADTIIFLGGMFMLAVIVGIIESVMARLRLANIPNLLIFAISLSVLAIFFQMR